MKIRISFKTPDALYYALRDMPREEREEAETICSKWIQFGECVIIEIDTENETAKVLEAK